MAETAGIDTAQRELIEDFTFLEDWLDRYQQLIDMGKSLPDFPDELRRDEFKVKGCQSQVWIVPEYRDGKLFFRAVSDSAIVTGLIACLLRVYSGRTPAEISATEPRFIPAIGLDSHLSPTRKNGLYAMLGRIKELAGGGR
jgi:cysteine desulfuration protein SufE